MPDKFYVGLDLTGFQDNLSQRPISRVTLRVDSERVLTAGDDTGLELTADCPHATQAMADSILARVKGYEYKMYDASDVNIDPSMELGDGITAGGLYSVISRISDDGSGFPGVSAPGQAELEDEYPAGGPMTQIIERKLAETRSTISKTAEEIRLEVERVQDGVTEMSASFSVQLNQITSRVQGAEGSISALRQTASSLQSQITEANGNISSITQTVSSISSSVEDLSGEVSKIQQTSNKISLSVTGALGSNASIVLDVNGDKQTQNLNLSNVRQSFANDNSAVTISGGSVTFNSNTFAVNSSNLQIDASGNLTVAKGAAIRGSTFYSETSTSSVSIRGGRFHVSHGETDVGYIGSNYWANNNEKKGISFDLNPYGSYMAWATKASETAASYTVKLIYASEMLEGSYNFQADRLYFECGSQFTGSAYFGLRRSIPDGRINGSGSIFSILAETGRTLSLGVDSTSMLEITADDISMNSTDKKLVHCYNNLNMHNYSVLNSSDERLKTNIEPSETDALSVINAVRTYSFDWVEDGRHENMGFIAQQLEAEASPDFVSVSEQDGYYSTKDLKMIPYLVKAVQELSAQLNELRGVSAARRAAKRVWTPAAYTLEEKEAYAASLRPNTIIPEPEPPEPVLLPA